MLQNQIVALKMNVNTLHRVVVSMDWNVVEVYLTFVFLGLLVVWYFGFFFCHANAVGGIFVCVIYISLLVFNGISVRVGH